MIRNIAIIVAFSSLAACGGQTSKVFSYQPQVWEGDESTVSVTRPRMASSYDTEKLANAHCANYGKVAKLTKLASPLMIPPMRDTYACE